jgi:hypothetical protein
MAVLTAQQDMVLKQAISGAGGTQQLMARLVAVEGWVKKGHSSKCVSHKAGQQHKHTSLQGVLLIMSCTTLFHSSRPSPFPGLMF